MKDWRKNIANLDELLNWGIPALLIIITLGFLWTKFINPWVLPMVKSIYDWISGADTSLLVKPVKEVQYD
jgi:hypothetical protein